MGVADRNILEDVKDNLNGIARNDDYFDNQIIDAINTVFTIFYQEGIGQRDKQFVFTGNETWSDFLQQTKHSENMEAMRTLLYKRVQLIFDPPTNGNLMNASKDILNELEYRMFISEDSDTDTIFE